MTRRSSYDQGENFSPNPPSGSKNLIHCCLANMRYIRDGICTGYIYKKAGTHQCSLGYKRYKVINQKIDQSISLYECREGEGSKSDFPPQHKPTRSLSLVRYRYVISCYSRQNKEKHEGDNYKGTFC